MPENSWYKSHMDDKLIRKCFHATKVNIIIFCFTVNVLSNVPLNLKDKMRKRVERRGDSTLGSSRGVEDEDEEEMEEDDDDEQDGDGVPEPVDTSHEDPHPTQVVLHLLLSNVIS